MTESQYERLEEKIVTLTTAISDVSTAIQIQTQRIDRMEDPDIKTLKDGQKENASRINEIEKRMYAGTVIIMVLYTILQFVQSAGWLK